MVFGPLSGSNHLMQILERAGITCDKLTAGQATPWIKNFYADRRKGVTDEEVVTGFMKFQSKSLS
jgi:2-isopropylmalate synthase